MDSLRRRITLKYDPASSHTKSKIIPNTMKITFCGQHRKHLQCQGTPRHPHDTLTEKERVRAFKAGIISHLTAHACIEELIYAGVCLPQQARKVFTVVQAS